MTASVHDAASTLLAELVDGAAEDAGWALNRKDPGILRSLALLSAADVSRIPDGGRSSIAAHVDHLRYGLSLLNRWSRGEADPFTGADWTQSWKRTTVTDAAWSDLFRDFQHEVRQWQAAIRTPRDFTDEELTGYLASIVHLAYHLGAIRQMNAAIRGPRDT